MTKKSLMVSAIVLLAAGCGKAVSTQSNTSVQTQQTANVQAGGQTSLKNLMMARSSQKCTVNYTMANGQSQGTIYLASGKMRGDFSTQVNGKTESTHMINDGQSIYTWIDGMSNGFKMSAQMNMSATSTKPSDHQNSIDPNANYQYNCSAWSADSGEFSQPSSVTFSSMDQIQTPMVQVKSTQTGGTAPSKSAECAACNSAGPGKAQCLAALGCN
jgi:hypothetical protein